MNSLITPSTRFRPAGGTPNKRPPRQDSRRKQTTLPIAGGRR